MKKPQKKQKLQIRKDTVRELSQQQLGAVAGGLTSSPSNVSACSNDR